MPKITHKLNKLNDKLTQVEKKKARLDASQNALRVVEQAIGGKLMPQGKKR